MTPLPSLAPLALVLVPWLHSELAGRAKSGPRARGIAVWGSAITLLLACALTANFFVRAATGELAASLRLPGGLFTLHFALDSLNAPLLLVVTLLALAIVLGTPASLVSPNRLRALLRLESLTLLSLTTLDLAVLALGYCFVLLPIRRFVTRRSENTESARLNRVFKIYHWFGLGCFVLALLLLGYHVGLGQMLSSGTLALDTSAVPEGRRPLLFGLFVVAVLVRMGVAPLHSWLPESLEHGALIGVTLLVSMRTGFYLLARFVIPSFPEETLAAVPLLTAVALLSAVYGAVAALGQRDLTRMLGFLVVSQSGIMLTGLVSNDEQAISGTLLYWVGFAVATTGMALVTAMLRARTGTSNMRELGGIVGRVPNLAAAFFLFGLATIAIPGTLAFAAEDMLVHGVLKAHPLLTIVMIVAMVLNAVTVVKAFASTFLGQTSARVARGPLEDLLPRERVVVNALLVALICGGLYPQALISAQAAAARRIAGEAHEDAHRAARQARAAALRP